MMQDCKEVSRGIASDEVENASWVDRLACWFHLLMCPDCRRYRDQIRNLGQVVREEAPVGDRATLERLEGTLLAGLDVDE